MINNTPNIFEYATKELSQDAVFMYLFDCFNSFDSNEKKMAHNLIENFYKKFDNIDNNFQVPTILKTYVKKQFNNIDILILLEKETDFDIFIIEDKTYSRVHDDQLKRYYTSIKNICNTPTHTLSCFLSENEVNVNTDSKHKKIANIYGFFFKIGEATPSEKKYCKIDEDFSYTIIDYKKIEEYLLKHQNVNSTIKMFCQYYSHRIKEYKTFDNYTEETIKKLLKADFHNLICNSYGQYKLMSILMQSVLERKNYNEDKQQSVSNHGCPCTQYRFIFLEGKEYDKSDDWGLKDEEMPRHTYAYFFRLDYSDKGLYVSIKQYHPHGDKSWDKKEFERNSIRNLLNNALCQNTSKLENKIHDNNGKNESQVCRFLITNPAEQWDELKRILQISHEIILDKLKLNN